MALYDTLNGNHVDSLDVVHLFFKGCFATISFIFIFFRPFYPRHASFCAGTLFLWTSVLFALAFTRIPLVLIVVFRFDRLTSFLQGSEQRVDGGAWCDWFFYGIHFFQGRAFGNLRQQGRRGWFLFLLHDHGRFQPRSFLDLI